MEKRLKTIRLTWIIILGLIALSLVWLVIVPFGTITYSTDFLSKNYFIGRMTPTDRLAGTEGPASRTITGEPVYFSLFTPRPFRRTTVTVEYNKPVPLLELGLRRDGVVWNYDRQPIEVRLLDELAQDSKTIREGDILLWQQRPRYQSIAEFVRQPPDSATIATYNYRLDTNFKIQQYQPRVQPRTIKLGLRGDYVMNIYSGGEAIDLAFMVHDLNLNKDPDPLKIILYDQSGKILQQSDLPDDGGMPHKLSEQRAITIQSGKIKAGVYRLEFKCNDDIITDSLTTKQSKLAFVNRIWLADESRENLPVYTDASRISAQTTAAASKQTIYVAGEALKLSETYQQFKIKLTDQSRQTKTINLERDSVILAADGMFSFSTAELFNPAPRQLDEQTSMSTSGVDYVIARYNPANGLKRSLSFDLANAYREKGKYSFLIAAPGVSDISEGLEIKAVSVRLEGETLFSYLKKMLARL